jgi:hypothetical protein
LDLFWDICQVLVRNFDWLPFTPSPLWSPSLILQLVSALVWSLVDFNRLYDPNATWRKVLSNLWSSMVRILAIRRTELASIF